MSDSNVPLIVNLSHPCENNEKVSETLISALSWHFESVEEYPVKAILKLSTTSVVIWVKGVRAAESLVKMESFAVSGPLSATFEFPRDSFSQLVEVLCKNKNKFKTGNLDVMGQVGDKLKHLLKAGVDIIPSNQRLMCQFDSPESATKEFQRIVALINKQDGDCTMSARQVVLKEYVLLKCFC